VLLLLVVVLVVDDPRRRTPDGPSDRERWRAAEAEVEVVAAVSYLQLVAADGAPLMPEILARQLFLLEVILVVLLSLY